MAVETIQADCILSQGPTRTFLETHKGKVDMKSNSKFSGLQWLTATALTGRSLSNDRNANALAMYLNAGLQLSTTNTTQ